ncbi:MAG TPA: Gmad2 immunoglobulin-like domain-containing protein [Anaerolineales bacterium]|nr:Gmad2 immunoglobulin-like domain-containing protein [Anaerolineales bacterium]
MIRKALPILAAILFLSACVPVGQIEIRVITPTATAVLPEPGSPTPEPTPTSEPATPTPAPTETATETATATASPENTATHPPPPPPATATQVPPAPTSTPGTNKEEILILAPGPGSRLTSPMTVSGEADSTFEQTLVIRVVLDDGTELALVPTIIQTEMGMRGPFEAQIEFEISGERQAFIQVLSTSARDGGITHLSSVGVTLADSGPVDIRPPFTTDEWIRIDLPVLTGQVSSPGTLHVAGFGYASFEQTLVVALLDGDGNVLASAPVIVQAPDLGQPGPFSVNLTVPSGYTGPGRVIVRDVSAAFDGTVHLASVEITFVDY